MLSSSIALLFLSQLALGAVTPTAPGPGEIFTAGSDCSVSWAPDKSGKWRSFSIDLMSGSNSNMSHVANVAKDLDGTDPSLSPYTWTCPDVDPYSTIYFYQFTPSVAAADEPESAWTTRFTITSPVGETTDPPHSKQPNGDSVPWGIGALRSGSSVASRKNHGGSEEDSEEDYSTDEDQGTGQRSSSGKAKGGTEYDEDGPATGTGARKGSSGSSGTSSQDSEDSEASEEDETSSSTKPGSSTSALKDTEEDSDAVDSKNGNEGSSSSPTSAEDEEPGFESAVSTSSRLKTVHSKPTSTPFPTGNMNAATLTIPLPSTPLSSAQPVGCAGGTNASSTYCSAPASTNYATHASKLDSRTLFATVLILSFGLL